MSEISLKVYLSHSQLCVFLSSLPQPFNDWSDRSFTQGFAWRPGSVSFRTVEGEADHKINFFVDEIVPNLPVDTVRAFRVPFDAQDGKIEIAGVCDTIPLDVRACNYILQVEMLALKPGHMPEINVRLNEGKVGFYILKADEEITVNEPFDLNAIPAM